MESYRTFLKDFATDSFTEKKSEFISYAARVENEEDAKAFLEKIRKKHADATHNCYAYILRGTGTARFSDDGEPSGTAGMPILEVLKREGLTGVCVVVTRYFGGILLGAGGLVRAYAKGAKLGIDAAGVADFVPYVCFSAAVSYAEHDKLVHEMPKYGIICDDVIYEANVTLYMRAKNQDFEKFCSFITDYTSGRAVCSVNGTTFGADTAPQIS